MDAVRRSITATQRKSFSSSRTAGAGHPRRELTRGLPPKLTAATGWTRSRTYRVVHVAKLPPATVALEGIHLIVDAFRARNGNDLTRAAGCLWRRRWAVAFQKTLVRPPLAHPLDLVRLAPWHGERTLLAGSHEVNASEKPGLYRRNRPAAWMGEMPDAEADARTIEPSKTFGRGGPEPKVA